MYSFNHWDCPYCAHRASGSMQPYIVCSVPEPPKRTHPSYTEYYHTCRFGSERAPQGKGKQRPPFRLLRPCPLAPLHLERTAPPPRPVRVREYISAWRSRQVKSPPAPPPPLPLRSVHQHITPHPPTHPTGRRTSPQPTKTRALKLSASPSTLAETPMSFFLLPAAKVRSFFTPCVCLRRRR